MLFPFFVLVGTDIALEFVSSIHICNGRYGMLELEHHKKESVVEENEGAPQRGRPREFDADLALERALEVFWRKGYEGTSISELTEAMGINRPSLYAAFGNKEALFRKALDRYAQGPAAYTYNALQEPTARAVVEHLFHGAADALTDPHYPHGCLGVQGALACGDAAQSVKGELCARQAAWEAALQKRLERAKRDGELSETANCTDLAQYIAAVLQGMAVQAAGGATRKQLRKVAAIALQAWPGEYG
jgi:AcrR family transcriptional regulator